MEVVSSERRAKTDRSYKQAFTSIYLSAKLSLNIEVRLRMEGSDIRAPSAILSAMLLRFTAHPHL